MVPLEAIPTTVSSGPGARPARSAAPASSLSSANSTELTIAGWTAGDQAEHDVAVGAEGRRDLSRVKDAQPAGRAGPNVDEAAALAYPRGGGLDGGGDGGKSRAHRPGDRGVAVVHQGDQFGDGELVKREIVVGHGLGYQLVEIGIG